MFLSNLRMADVRVGWTQGKLGPWKRSDSRFSLRCRGHWTASPRAELSWFAESNMSALCTYSSFYNCVMRMSGEKYKSWNHQLEWMSPYPSLSDHQGDQQAWIQPNKQRKPTEAAKHVHLMMTQLPSSAPSFIIYRYKISLMFLSSFFFPAGAQLFMSIWSRAVQPRLTIDFCHEK